MIGTIKRLFAGKGFGFIHATDGKEYFFHRSDFNGFFEDLETDVTNKHAVQVSFESVFSDKGPRAANVTRTDGGVITDGFPTG